MKKSEQRVDYYRAPLSEEELWEYLTSQRLIVTPLLDREQVGRASLDIRLGNEFIVMRGTSFLGIDVGEYRTMKKKIHQYQERLRVNYGDPFVLHPQDFVLTSTFEYFALPANIIGFVIGRSSWGRLGIINATATFIDPGFTGSITLEIANLGNQPITLYPCLRIGQIVFHELRKETKRYQGRYAVTVGPKFSEVYLDPDLPRIIPFRREDDPEKRNTNITAKERLRKNAKENISKKVQDKKSEKKIKPTEIEIDKGFFAKTIDFIAKR